MLIRGKPGFERVFYAKVGVRESPTRKKSLTKRQKAKSRQGVDLSRGMLLQDRYLVVQELVVLNAHSNRRLLLFAVRLQPQDPGSTAYAHVFAEGDLRRHHQGQLNHHAFA